MATDTNKSTKSRTTRSSLADEAFEGVPAPAKIIECIRKFVRGTGQEREYGRSGLNATIKFYSDADYWSERQKLVEFLKKVLEKG